MNDFKVIGKNMKVTREAKGMTQAEVAKRCKITTNYYARIERGERKFTIMTLKKVAKALDVKASQILSF